MDAEQINDDFDSKKGPSIIGYDFQNSGQKGEYDYRTNTIRFSNTELLRIEGFLKGALGPETFSANPDLVEKLKLIILSNKPIGICGALLALACRTDTSASLSKISVPTLILVGEKDAITPPSVSEVMKDHIPMKAFF